MSEVVGSYVYRMSTGEIEVLSLDQSMTFEHSLFANLDAFANGMAPLVHENGRWSLSGTGIDLNMDGFFQADFPTPENRLAQPRPTAYTALWWRREGPHRAAIVRNDETGYIMFRVTQPAEVDEISWRYPS